MRWAIDDQIPQVKLDFKAAAEAKVVKKLLESSQPVGYRLEAEAEFYGDGGVYKSASVTRPTVELTAIHRLSPQPQSPAKRAKLSTTPTQAASEEHQIYGGPSQWCQNSILSETTIQMLRHAQATSKDNGFGAGPTALVADYGSDGE